MSAADKIQQAIDEFLKAGFDQEEEDMFTDVAVLNSNDPEPKKIAAGKIRILKNKKTGRTRLLMRDHPAQQVLLNHYIMPGMDIEDDADFLRWSATDYATNPKGEDKHIVISFPPVRMDSGSKFVQEFKKAKERNASLLK
ncbi:RanBP1 domain containing protein [Trichomonas vaginalis G3]|uniref:RanBP1 domain containing protein n=1 Tax=Trichomonas vaginalis (strain ATCC PRA-98 / G3) TaxID=412133 RepID=A2ELU5_TRIV3|nr:Ran-binding protein 1-like protein [Trichomonas vaginalis G3]EAY06373.1 RanBP1 domain containing protein [Trichomonas vaginalis G3]KAI5534687.1 Ran-binding protein 1-like protein [Trichomonas vaginalis G3]|eukprot:XP_001318596.1 RanBP1 domain containing protein [Trichomonas vaginalis G3]